MKGLTVTAHPHPRQHHSYDASNANILSRILPFLHGLRIPVKVDTHSCRTWTLPELSDAGTLLLFRLSGFDKNNVCSQCANLLSTSADPTCPLLVGNAQATT